MGEKKRKAPRKGVEKAPAKARTRTRTRARARPAPVAKPASKRAKKPAARRVAKAAEKAPRKTKPAAKRTVPRVAKLAKVPPKTRKPHRVAPLRPPAVEGLDPDGYFVARVRGEDAARQAPHPMTEGAESEDADALRALAAVPVPPDDEGLGELPWSYGEDVLVALPRDPRTLFFYWDHSPETLHAAFEWLDRPRAQLRVSVMGADGEWEPLRIAEFALESRGWYFHDLEPGRTYRGEIFAVSRDGRERPVGAASNEVALPPSGPSPVVDDRFAVVPWDLPLDGWLREVRTGGAFPDELRSLLARLSAGVRPSAPDRQVRSEPGRPSSPPHAWGGDARPRRKGRKEGA